MSKSKEIEELDTALEEIKDAKAKLSKLRQIVEGINGNGEKCDKNSRERVQNGAKRVEALVVKAKKAKDKLS